MAGAFEGRVVIVTGGGSGVGRALAAGFFNEGARVAIASRDPDRLKQAARVIASRPSGRGPGGAGAALDRLLPLRVDVRVAAAVEAVASAVSGAWGRIDILINSAAVSGPTPIDDSDPAAEKRWLDALDTNLAGVWRMTRACLPRMPEGGRIINVAPAPGGPGLAGRSAWIASRHGLIGLTRSLSAELAPRGITVNAIGTGWAAAPAARSPKPEDLVALALRIASPGAAAMTGQAVDPEGGAAAC